MPGLVGVINTGAPRGANHEDLVRIVRGMCSAMRYEPWYRDVLVSVPSLGVCAATVGSRDECASRAGDPIVLRCGETSHRPFAADGRDIDPWRPFLGRCAGFVADKRSRTCALFNDKYGRERLFVHVDGSRTYFASEAKAILAVAPRTRALDAEGLAEFLGTGATLGARSLYRDIEVLDPGTLLTFDAAGMKRRRFFSAADLEQRSPAASSEFIEGFAASLAAEVARSVDDSPSIAISLTGGLDSRMVMASLDRHSGTIPCYTFGSMYRTTGDVKVARQVAALAGQPHHVIVVGQGFLTGIRDHFCDAVYASDGYLGLSGAAELYANRQARTIAAARMTGNWGGELMRGVRAFKFGPPSGAFVSPQLQAAIRDMAEPAFSQVSSNSLSAALFNQIPLQGYGRYAIERSQLRTCSPFLADDAVEWLYRAPTSIRASSESAAAIIGRRPELLTVPTDIGVLRKGNPAIRKVWRKTLVKAEYLLSHGAPHWMARLSSSLPASLLETRFLGVDKFAHFRFWMRHDLAGFIRETLAERDATDLGAWFDMRRVRAMAEDHIAGRANYTSEIDKVLTLAVVQKTLLADRRWSHEAVPDAVEVAG